MRNSIDSLDNIEVKASTKPQFKEPKNDEANNLNLHIPKKFIEHREYIMAIIMEMNPKVCDSCFKRIQKEQVSKYLCKVLDQYFYERDKEEKRVVEITISRSNTENNLVGNYSSATHFVP
tara:strand:+ start:625 stop:984 length:360 start_codon:yes stop_codon:yes gene_type:complete